MYHLCIRTNLSNEKVLPRHLIHNIAQVVETDKSRALRIHCCEELGQMALEISLVLCVSLV